MTLKIIKKLFPVDKKVTLSFSSVFPYEISSEKKYTVYLSPLSNFRIYGKFKEGITLNCEAMECFYKQLPVKIEGDRLILDIIFPQEDEYKIKVYQNGNLLDSFKIFALDNDLYQTTPYKGDGHMHTYYSDGLESPEYVAACCRTRGLDFIAVTDHRQYFPSIRAQQKFEPIKTDFLILNGEEVHSPGNNVHIINFGGSFSVNEWFNEKRAEYDCLVASKLATIIEPMSDYTRYNIAASMVIFDKIREGGGVAVFCHPYWETGNGYDISEDITQYLMEHKPFDALELIGGYTTDEYFSNPLQTAYQSTMFPNIPVVGHTDSHGQHRADLGADWYYMIVFAKDLSLPSLREAVINGKCVAVDASASGFPKVYGSYRLVKYTYFLLENVYPTHDDICSKQGLLMRKFVMGKDDILDNLNSYNDKAEDYYKELK